MPPSSRQGDLFSASDAQQGAAPMPRSTQLPEALTITAAQLQAWQARIHRHQQPLLHQPQTQGEQTLLFAEADRDPLAGFDPLALKPLLKERKIK